MLALIVIANPNPSSLSHAMAKVAEKALIEHQYELAMHDLYTERFDPVQSVGEMSNTSSDNQLVEQHCSELSSAELILIFHPNWWGQPPAILKGWIDRVFRLGTAYDYPEGVSPDGVPIGLLRAKQALIFNTSNTPSGRETDLFGDPLEALWKNCIFGLCGVHNVVRRMYAPVSGSTSEQRSKWLAEVQKLVDDAY
jgi:NAD(P)H dehydrogenase (quinone)